MKGFIKVLFVLVAIIVVWILYVNREAARQEEERLELERVQEERLREEAAKEIMARSQKQSATPTPRAKVVIQRHTLSKKEEIYLAAKAAQVTIVGYREQGNEAFIDCKAKQRNYLGDFLDELTNRGIMKDLDLKKTHYRVTLGKEGGSEHWAHYEIRW